MKRHHWGWALVLACVIAAPTALAQTTTGTFTTQRFNNFLQSLSAPTSALGVNDKVPILQGGSTKGWAPANYFLNRDASNVDTAATARTNLGLGTASTLNSPIPLASGGTAATTAAEARTNLGLGTAATHPITDFLQPSNNLSDVGNAATARGSLSAMGRDAADATLPNVLNNLGLSSQLAVAPICTTTNGSVAVTACNSTVGITVGMIVKGPGVPANATVAGGITATDFTLSGVAGVDAAAGQMVHLRPSFWLDTDGTAPSVVRVPGRLMVGGAVGRNNDLTNTGNLDICPSASYCASWALRNATIGVISPIGGMSIVGMVKASMGDDIATTPVPIALTAIAINDSTLQRSTWGQFIHATNRNTTSAKTWGIEIGLKNQGYEGTTTPYQEMGGPTGISIRGGSDESFGGLSTGPSNAAIYIAHGGSVLPQTFNTGIVFDSNALVGNDGTTGLSTAINMARGMLVKWTAPNSQLGAFIYGDVTGSDSQQSIVFTDDKTSIRGASGLPILDVIHVAGTTPVNRHKFKDAATGVAPEWECAGSDTDVDCVIRPNGAGEVKSYGNVAIMGSSSGGIRLAAPAAAGNNTITLPAGTTDFTATGGVSQVVKQTSVGGALTVARLACADLSDAGTGCASATPATAQSTCAAPTGTTDTSGVMSGCAVAITPTSSGKLVISVSGSWLNNTAASGTKAAIRYGTGTAPVNGAAETGTECGARPTFLVSTTGRPGGFALNCIVTGLTPSTAHWIDVSNAANVGGTSTLTQVSFSAHEIR